MIHSESLLPRADSHQPASHLRAPTTEVVGSVPFTGWIRDLNHPLTEISIFASKADEAVRGGHEAKQANNLDELVL